MTTPEPIESGQDTHYDWPLDDQPDPQRAPVYVDAVVREHTRQPIVPASLRGRQNLTATAKRSAGNLAHRAGYHAARSPRYLLLGVLWAFVGIFRVAGQQIRWWWVAEQHALRQEAATKNDPDTWYKLHREARATRTWRGSVLGVELLLVVVVVSVLVLLAPRWVAVLTVAIAVPVLAHVGRPVDRRIVTPAIVTPRFRKLTADIVLRAYYAAKLGSPDKPDQQVRFASPMSGQPGNGIHMSRVVVDLPWGKGFPDVVKAKQAVASGLDVTEFQVFFRRDKTSIRRHTLLVADRDPLAIPAGRTDLLDLKPRDIWKPARFGLDEYGRPVTVPLMWHSVLIGAQPRRGKTFSARLLGLHGAADPWVKLLVVDGKNSPDWRKFALVADRMVYGTHPDRDGDPVTQLLDLLYAVKKHIQKTNQILSRLPADQCPEGKLTPTLARDPRYPELRVWMLVMEEFQLYFELDDQNINKEIAGLLSFIQAVGPSAGVIVLSSSQKPSGIGAGQDVPRLFNRYRDNHVVRFALKCATRQVSEAVLGSEAYGEGFDASTLPVGDEYRGVGYLYGLTDETPLVRTYLCEHPDAERILLAARARREAAGTLSGEAAGEEVSRQARDVLRDVRDVFWAGEAWVSWQQLASRLAERLPEAYAGTTKEAISAQVRGLGVAAKKGWEDGASLWGVPREQVDLAIKRREIESGR